ncbi:hypothetical protein H0Z09_06385 [Pseudomonas sp. SWRI18]|uniref:hypothetical protein n=1 Tax=Pseudomonas sp. SWRI18 TaxID=2753888 RepID=UPI001645EEA0|nr:hypothetical protein [Pseudomonas sp. SWRI18]MBC3300742.1 hypothetical protein [Pseudomonas sp. SWRI18]
MLVRLLSPLADGVPAQTISSYDGGATWARGLSFERGLLMSVAAGLTNEVAIDGSVTLTVKHL